MGSCAPFSSPPAAPRIDGACRSCAESKPSWASAALLTVQEGSSPAVALHKLITLAGNMTNSSEKLTGSAAMALATGGKLPWLMDAEDAAMTLKFVATKEQTREAKRPAKADAAAAASLVKKQRVGASRAAKRAEIAARPVKTRRTVDNTGRVSVF